LGYPNHVIPAKAGIQPMSVVHWIPACAGMTKKGPRREHIASLG